MIRVSVNSKALEEKLTKLTLSVRDGVFDQATDAAAWRVFAKLVEKTPKKWTGLTRRSWKVVKRGRGSRMLFNDSKVMRWLEDGTANAGYGFIYPKTKRVLFIPLNARAALNGWSEDLVPGKDYILRRRVRGITPRHIVRDTLPEANKILAEEMRKFLKQVLT